jgi:ankyrin repeat protein
LTLAAQHGCEAVVRVLLDAGANPRVSSSMTGSTPLHRAAQNGNLEVVQLLLNAGANPLAEKHNIPKTPVDTALMCDHEKILEVMLSNILGEEKSTHLHTAVKKTLEHIVTLLIDPQRGYDISAKDGFGRTVLFYSVAGGFENITTHLLEKGIDTQLKDSDGRLAIDMAWSKSTRQLILANCQTKISTVDATGEDGVPNCADREDNALCGTMSYITSDNVGRWCPPLECGHCDKYLDGSGSLYRKSNPHKSV